MSSTPTPPFESFITEDGSPTMGLAPTWEPMHARDGAFTETLYIYQPTAERALQHVDQPEFLSLGLGLGYNEMLIVFECLKMKREPAKIHSYEKMDFLIENFSAWIRGEDAPLSEIYNQILALYSDKYRIPAENARVLLKKLLVDGRLLLNGPFTEATPVPPCHGVFFDAFSSKTSPDLWTPAFLQNFFSHTASICFISTYACTGELKRTLRANGFTLAIQKGFGKKRHSTFASKGLLDTFASKGLVDAFAGEGSLDSFAREAVKSFDTITSDDPSETL